MEQESNTKKNAFLFFKKFFFFRTCHLGGIPHENNSKLTTSTTSKPPEFIRQLILSFLENNLLENANHCLLNDYKPGAGIAAHLDGSNYEPHVVVLSLGESCLLEFIDNDDVVCSSLFLEPNSCLIFKGKYYTDFKHRILAQTFDLIDEKCLNLNQTRVAVGQRIERKNSRLSLTIRKLKSKPNWKIKNIDNNIDLNEEDEIILNENARDERKVKKKIKN